MSVADWLAQTVSIQADERIFIVALATVLAGFLRGFIGFGSALVCIPVISLCYGPLLALPVVNIMGIPSTLQLLPDAVRESEWPIVVPMSIAIFVAAPIGTLVLVSVDPALMKIAISALVVSMVGFLAMGWQLGQHVHKSILWLAGALGGLAQGVAGVGGPPVVAVALSRSGSPERQRGNVLAAMTAIALASVPPLYFYGLFTRQAIILGLLLLPIHALATWLGQTYFGGRGRDHYRGAALALLALIASTTLLLATWNYFADQ